MFFTKKTLLLSIFLLIFAFVLTGCEKKEDKNSQNENINQPSMQSEDTGDMQNVDNNENSEQTGGQDQQNNPQEGQSTEQNTTIVDEVNWRVFTNSSHGYSVNYPGICNVSGDIENNVEFTGPLEDNEWWPKISINHNSSAFYRPPVGTDVKEWVAKFSGFKNGEDITIAGLPTVHFVQERSPQSYAADYFYFIKGNQLYQITILHTGDKKDLPLYNKFLNSFAFAEEENEEVSHISCQADADCIPTPGCHPITCINRDFSDQYEQPQVCTLQFECKAAYTEEDCLCQENVCINKNKDSLCLE